MNNLYRQLAPITDEAWEQISDEARRTFAANLAGRRVVDVAGPDGPGLSALGTGHVRSIATLVDDVEARQRIVQPLVELRAPFTLDRSDIDDVERGAQDSNWQPVKDAARKLAIAEDRLIVNGYPAADIGGIVAGSSNAPIPLPAEPEGVVDVVAQAVSALRLVGVAGPYSLLLSAETYTQVAEATDHGNPIRDHIVRTLGDGGQVVWAPAITGGLLVSTRGGDYQLQLGRDTSIGYLSHDADTVTLYLEESVAFLAATAEASVVLPAATSARKATSRRQ